MAGVCNFSREIQDSIRDVLDRRVKLYIRRLVRQEGRSDKLENRILVFSACRLFVMSARVPTKVESSIHYLDIQSIESKTTNQLILTVDGKSSTFTAIEEDTDEINHMITHIGTSLKQVFTSFPLERLIKKIEVQPPDRLKTMHDMIRDLEAKPVSPCGGYTMMYACMCDYHGLPYRDEVAWDVDTIYLSQDSKELCLQDFDHLNSRDMAPIISALEHNPWFTKLNANNVRLTPEAMVEILRVMKRNAVIEELCLSGTGMTSDFTQKLATAILSNSGSQLSKVDLSLNPIDERGAIHFIGATSSLSRGLSYLDMSRIKLSGKGLNKLVETLSQGPHLSSTLTFLNLSDNSSKGEDLQYLYNFLAQPNAITHLNLSGTDCALDHLFGAMLRGSCTCVRSLQLSRNTYTHKKMKDIVVQQSWKRFFSSVVALEHLDLSCNKLPPEALKELLLGIASNRHIASLHLDISSNELQTQGAHNLGSCIADLRQITSLDISNNGFDQEITNLTTWIGQNKSLKHLALGRNFSGIKPKHLSNTLDSIVQLIQDDDSAIVSLSLADSRLKSSLAVVVNALGSNVSLTEINLSGNSMGDYGARMLSKALQINNHLQTIQLDKNGLTAQGFEDIAEAMEKNYVLKKMPTPLNDAAAALRTQQERTEKALQRIEELLQRNHSPQKFASDQAYRLQQGFLISSTQQMVDRLVVQVQDNINALSIGSTNSFEADIQQTQDIVKDADNSKQLLPQLQDIAMKSLDAGNPVDTKLREMAAELNGVLQKHIQRTVTDMIECTKSKCSAIMGEKVFVSDMEKGCVEKSALPRDFAKHILDGISTDLYNTLSELNLAVAAHISDRAVDEVITSLSHSHKTLVNHLNKKKQEDRDQVSSLRFKPGAVESPKLTSKKKSLYGRKLRPQSVVDGTDPNTKSGSKIVNKIEEAESIESLDDVTELKQVQKLNHIIKDRPKRARSHAPSRPMTRQTKVIDDKSDQEEGLDKFFSKSLASDEFVVISNDKDKDNNKTETSSGTGSESTQSTPDSKKKAGWLKSLGGKKDDKKQSPSLFARNKGFKSSEEKINRISEADEGKSDADKGPVNTTPDPQPAEKSDVLKPPFKKNSKSSAPDKQVDKSDTTADATPQTPPSDTPENTLPVTSDGEDLSPVSPATPDSEPSTETEVKNETEENNEEKKETPSPSSRRYPVGIPKIGHGVNVLAEIKAKQEKRLTIQTSKPKDVKMSGKIKKDETKEEKEEKIPIGLQDSHKSSSDENQSAHSSISSVEDLKTDIEKPSSPAKEERKAPSVSELNNNITNKLSKSLPGNDLSTPKQKTVRQASTDLSVKVKVGMKPPPPMKPRPPPVALKPGKGKPADDDSTENKHETSEQEETSSPRQSKSTVSSPRHSTESSPRHSIESSEASSAKLRDKKPGSDTQSVKDRIKSMELGQALVSDANTTDKANSLPRDVTPGKLKKTDRPSSVHVGRYSNAKAPLKSDLARSSPSLNIDKDNETIYENLKLDMVDDTDIYENLRDSVKNGSLKGNQEVEVKLEGKMDTEDEVDKIKPEKNAEDKTENSEGSATDVILV